MTSEVYKEPDSGYPRLEEQISWYDRKSGSAQKLYKYTKFAEFCFGALIPFTANINATITAVLGGAIIILEGLQQINQWQNNWITYRSTCEALRHEKYSYMSRSGAFSNLSDDEAKKTLAERIESLISTEHAKWISRQEYKPKEKQER